MLPGAQLGPVLLIAALVLDHAAEGRENRLCLRKNLGITAAHDRQGSR